MEESHSKSTKDKSPLKLTAPFISALFSISFLALLIHGGLDATDIGRRCAWPILRLMGIIAVTLSLSALVEGMGWNMLIAKGTRPLMRLGRFSDDTGIAFTTAFLSGIAANTILMNAFEESRIGERELILSNLLITGLPSYFIHLPTTIAIIVPLVGKAGVLYLTITFLAACLRTVFVTMLGRLSLKNQGASREAARKKREKKVLEARKKRVIRLIKRYLSQRLIKIALYTIPIYLGVVVAQTFGAFHWLQVKSAQMIHIGGIPVEGVSVVAFTILAEFTAGAAAAGAMLESGILTVKETVLALVVGNLLATPVRALRHQLPRYLGIYTPRLGIKLLAAGQILRVTSVIIVTAIFYTL